MTAKSLCVRIICYLRDMKRYLTLLLSLLCLWVSSVEISAQKKSPQDIYIEKYSALAVEEMIRTGVPASITLAQGLLESGYGLSELAVKGNNHFGIKCHNTWKGARVFHDDDRKGECFRKYDSPEQSYRDHSDFLRYRDRYRFLFDYRVTDYRSWAYGLSKAGYATDPSYPAKLIRLIEEYALHEYDMKPVRFEKEELPPPPAQIEKVTVYPKMQKKDFHFKVSREVYMRNGVPFVYSEEGDTYESIAASYDLFKKEILRFNDLQTSLPLAPGTVVYIHAKKGKAAKGLDKHVVEAGESMRDIAQRYGVKLNKLYKINGMTDIDVPSEGDMVKLRK